MKKAKASDKKTIILVSEDGTMRKALESMLQSEAYAITVATHSLEALKILKKNSIDLILLDTLFSDGKCEDFLGLVENVSLNESIGFVLLVEDCDENVISRYKTELRSFCLPRKNVKKEDLTKAIRQVLDPSYVPEPESKKLKGRILIVDQDSKKAQSITNCLREAGLETFEAIDGSAGLNKAREKLPEVILVNANLPDKSGVDFVKDCKKDPALGSIPILVLCEEAALITARTEAFSNGALGCVSYPINVHELLAQVGVLVNLTQTQAEIQAHAVSLAVSNFELQETRQLLEQNKKELEKSSEYKSEFLAKMSHELRTPLTAMMGFAQKALHSSPDEPEYKTSIRTILRNGAHLLELINDILDLSKIEAGKLALNLLPTSPVEILQDVQALMCIRAEQKGIDFWIEYQSDIPEKIISDPMRLKQILLNLVGNSIKFTQKGSVKICLSCVREDEVLLFQVVDTGIGISEEKKKELFQAFVQGDTEVTRKFGGTGLGLTISLQLAEMLGGSIAVDSILGMGSSFKVSIKTGPLGNAKFLTSAELENIKSIAKGGEDIRIERLEGRVLIAEDNPDNQKLLEYYLKKSGVNFKTVTNGNEALTHALDEEFNLVLMDMQMPIMDGYTATKKLRDRGYVKPIFGLTANNLESEVKKALDAGCDKVFSKPYDWNVLFSNLKEHIGVSGSNDNAIVLTPSKDLEKKSAQVQLGTDSKKASVQEMSKPSKDAINKGSAAPMVSQMYDSNPDLQPLIIEFLEGLHTYVATIEKNIESKSWTDLKAIAHDVSGVSGMYGYPECSECAKKLRLACMQKDEAISTESANELIRCLKRMELGLKVIRGEPLPVIEEAKTETQVITSELFDLSPDLAPQISEFLDNISATLDQIKEETQAMNWSAITTITNEMSGTASLFGYPTFATAAKKLEEAILAGNTTTLPKLLEDLESMKDAMIRGRK